MKIWIWFCTSKELNHLPRFAFPLILDKFENVLVYSSCLLISLYNQRQGQDVYIYIYTCWSCLCLQPLHTYILLLFLCTLSLQIFPFFEENSIFFALRRKIVYVSCDWLIWLSNFYINIYLFHRIMKNSRK